MRADYLRTFRPAFMAMDAAYWQKESADLLDGADDVAGGSVTK